MEEQKKKRKKKNLLHECALLMKEYFRNQRSLFTSLKYTLLTKKKFLKQKPLECLLCKGNRKVNKEEPLILIYFPLFIEVGMLKK